MMLWLFLFINNNLPTSSLSTYVQIDYHAQRQLNERLLCLNLTTNLNDSYSISGIRTTGIANAHFKSPQSHNFQEMALEKFFRF